MNTFERISELHRKLLGKYTQKLIEDKITVDQYLSMHEKINRSIMLFARTFDDVNEFQEYYCGNYPNADIPPQKQVEHEVEHYNIGIKHGLKYMSFGLFEVNDEERTHQPIFIDHLSANCKGWNKKRLLGYIKDSYEAVNKQSEGDKRSANSLKKLGI